MKEYYQRVSDKVLMDHLESKGAVLIEGAKWCGKTTSAKHIAKSVIEMDRPDMTEQYQQMARIKPSNLLEGEVPHLIDEWQIAGRLQRISGMQFVMRLTAEVNSVSLYSPVLLFLLIWMTLCTQVQVESFVCE